MDSLQARRASTITSSSRPEANVHSYEAVPIRRARSLEQSSTTANILGAPFKDVEQFYVLNEKVLGEGVSGCVRTCIDRATGDTFACKTILKSSLLCPSDVDNLRNEVKAMLEVAEHPAVVGLKDLCEDNKAVHLIMDLCEGGDLFDRVKLLGTFSEQDAACIVRILVSVIQHCNAKGIVHRDLKPENLLMMSHDSHSSIKVADFGHSGFFKPGQKMTRAVGTGYYIAPEVLGRSYGPEADLWSVGVILYVLLAGRPPFMAKDTPGVFEKICAGVYDLENGPWAGVSDSAKDLISRLLCNDPKKRATIEEVKGHPWVQHHCGVRLSGPVYKMPSSAAAPSPRRQPALRPLKVEASRVGAEKSYVPSSSAKACSIASRYQYIPGSRRYTKVST